jgi:hypothetical protein
VVVDVVDDIVHLAIYKACGGDTRDYPSIGLLQAFNKAVADRVDVISVSFSFSTKPTFNNDPIAISTFNDM